MAKAPVAKDDEKTDEKERLVPKKYVEKYGKARSNQDDVANALKEYVQDEKGKIDEEKLVGVARDNGLSEKLETYQGNGLNIGMQRMNIGNLLRGMVNKGLDVTIGKNKIKGKPVVKKEKAPKKEAA